jgi:hypothetical protein
LGENAGKRFPEKRLLDGESASLAKGKESNSPDIACKVVAGRFGECAVPPHVVDRVEAYIVNMSRTPRVQVQVLTFIRDNQLLVLPKSAQRKIASVTR